MQKAWGPRGESRFLGEHSEESLEAGWGGGVPRKTMRTHPVQGRGSRNAYQLHAAGEGGSERREGDKITLIFTKSIQVRHGARYRDEDLWKKSGLGREGEK